ncbi:hypothetical protein C8Q69DRAFT_441325 [Paecilomyces variotii]|uniref:Uncharacterized protein n=1 Tax=Byssochlamys spectabilis TaxID=264951 RepID=A0A443I8G6_BYSSP|nr:hypothetical protein C8Q69DRAFT_441325 [Paecilomyces variotii]KAJ9365832.1 hypothetical protein DTO280E4_128 [Paecilomyces variotii]RWR00287.1 hypothetical protein C8Q69DRAFT_441325 [Paecilomyces variotii]
MGLFSKLFPCAKDRNGLRKSAQSSRNNRPHSTISPFALVQEVESEQVNARPVSDIPMLDMPSFSGYSVSKPSEKDIDHPPVYASSSTSHNQQESTEDVPTERDESNSADLDSSTEPQAVSENPRDVETITTTSDEAIDPLSPSQHSPHVADDETPPEMTEVNPDILEPPPSYELAAGVRESSTDKPRRRSIIDILIRRGSTIKTTPPVVTPIWRPAPAPAPIIPDPITEHDPDRFTYVIGGREFDDSADIYCL